MSLTGLIGKTAIVTGAAQGLGAAIADRLLAEGCNVFGVDSAAAQLESFASRRAGSRLLTCAADVSDEEACARYAAAAITSFGRIDLFVNNAGILTPVAPIAAQSVESFDQAFRINVRGVFLGMRAAIRQMIVQNDGGSIVNMASLAAVRAAPQRSLYGATKRAVIGLSQSAALENASAGIRVNAVLPGAVDTPMSRVVDANRATIGGHMAAVGNYPLGRKGTPEEVASFVAWLLSDEASYATGGVYTLDGAASA